MPTPKTRKLNKQTKAVTIDFVAVFMMPERRISEMRR